MIRKCAFMVATFLLGTLLISDPLAAQGFEPVDNRTWTETAVRKVLHVFAYGGFASDAQIRLWSEMDPADAIREMLTFEVVNQKLSPVQDATADYGGSLEALQAFWSSDNPDNPTRPDKRGAYSVVKANGNLSGGNLQNTWIAAVNKRGLNPFRQKVGLWLTNYHMAVNLQGGKPPLIREHYDSALLALEQVADFADVLAVGAASAAVAREYGHQNNVYIPANNLFIGNDDFAREFHQLFFRILGTTEDPDYHENVTIEHTAWTLTGMQIDKEPNAYGSSSSNDWWVAPIDFSDHADATGRNISNISRHYPGELEVLNSTIDGISAEEKIFSLAQVAINHPESLDNIPVAVIDFFADDNLSEDKIQAIREAWRSMQPKDLLAFLQDYAVSTVFHRNDTYKYRTAFSRNMTIYNLNSVDNEESYANSYSPKGTMSAEGAEVFEPAHDVFGAQTGLDAANSPDLFKNAYNATVNSPSRIIKVRENFSGAFGQPQTWQKDWALLIPPNSQGDYRVKAVGEWIWDRFISDNRKNYGPLERAYVAGLLATGDDLGYIVDPDNADQSYSVSDLQSPPLSSIILDLESSTMDLDNPSGSIRRTANRRIGLAVGFITTTPFMYAIHAQDACKGDFTDDDTVNASDLESASAVFGQSACQNGCSPDLDGDGDIDAVDILEFSVLLSTNNCLGALAGQE